MKRSIIVIIWILLTASISILAACEQPGATAENNGSDLPSFSWQSLAQSGNLHYQNLVLAVNHQIVYNSENGQLILAAPDGSDVKVLVETGGSSPAWDGQQIFYISETSGQLSKIDT
jgi:hypothetical protein